MCVKAPAAKSVFTEAKCAFTAMANENVAIDVRIFFLDRMEVECVISRGREREKRLELNLRREDQVSGKQTPCH